MSWHYLYTFFQSNGVEVLFLIFFYPVGGRLLKSRWDTALVVSLANSITHPVVLFLILKGPFTYLWGVLLAESFAVISEVFIHRHFLGVTWKRACIGSLIANLLSWQLGALLTTYFFLSHLV